MPPPHPYGAAHKRLRAGMLRALRGGRPMACVICGHGLDADAPSRLVELAHRPGGKAAGELGVGLSHRYCNRSTSASERDVLTRKGHRKPAVASTAKVGMREREAWDSQQPVGRVW